MWLCMDGKENEVVGRFASDFFQWFIFQRHEIEIPKTNTEQMMFAPMLTGTKHKFMISWNEKFQKQLSICK